MPDVRVSRSAAAACSAWVGGLAGGLLLAGAGACAAQTASPDWTVELGGATRVRPTHIGSRRYVVDGVPILEATLGEDVEISLDDGVRWRAVKLGPVTLGPIAEYRQSFNDDVPRGAFQMSDAIEIGGFGAWRTPVGVAEARLRRAVNGYQGWSGDLSFVTGGAITPKLMLGAQARISWADSNFTQEYFGLKPHAASRLGLPRFQEGDFLTVGGEIDAARELTPHTRVVLELTADHIVSELQPSPLFSTRQIFTAVLGLTYRWSAGPSGRSP